MAQFKLQSSQRIIDGRGRIILGEGRVKLLALIDETGSINQAAKQMRMSYKSAWSKLKSTELHLGAEVVHSDKRTGSRLTPLGRRLLDQYRQMKARCIAADDRIFEAVFHPTGPPPHRVAQAVEPDPPSARRAALPPIVAVVGYSGSGKTTLIENLIPLLKDRGLRVATIKHHHRNGPLDTPGKDTWRHKQAGAVATLVAAPGQIQLVMDVAEDLEPNRLAGLLPPVDVILVEGYKHGALPKIEIYRPEATGADPPLATADAWIRAIATDAAVDLPAIRVFGLAELAAIADFIATQITPDPTD